MKTFDIALAGFDGSTDKTDHLIWWVNAPSEAAVLAFVAAEGWELKHPPTRLGMTFELGAEDGVDVEVDADGKVLRRHRHQ